MSSPADGTVSVLTPQPLYQRPTPPSTTDTTSRKRLISVQSCKCNLYIAYCTVAIGIHSLGNNHLEILVRNSLRTHGRSPTLPKAPDGSIKRLPTHATWMPASCCFLPGTVHFPADPASSSLKATPIGLTSVTIEHPTAMPRSRMQSIPPVVSLGHHLPNKGLGMTYFEVLTIIIKT